MIDYKKLYGVSKVKGETTFISYIKKKDDLYQKLIYGFKNNLVKSFDQEIISELRKCYYGIFSGLIYIFSTVIPSLVSFTAYPFSFKLSLISSDKAQFLSALACFLFSNNS